MCAMININAVININIYILIMISIHLFFDSNAVIVKDIGLQYFE